MSKYQRLSKEIAKLDTEIEETTQALTEVQERVDSAQGRLDVLWESLKAKLMQEDKTSVKDVEAAIDEAKKANQRDKALLEGLKGKLPALEQEREALVSEQNKVIVNSGDKWLAQEIKTYEKQREALLCTVRRLSAVSGILHQTGEEGREATRRHLGEVWGYLRTLKIPGIKAFNARVYTEETNPDLVVKPNERAEVINELTK